MSETAAATTIGAAAEPPKGLVTKLAEVMLAVERIAKRGRNDFHNYSYATEADIAEAIREELANRHVMLIPSVESVHREPVGEKGQVLTTLMMTFTFLDGESGEELKRGWCGAGTDKEDKGLYKAMTGGEKYFLLKTFLLPTGDDPERDSGSEARPAKRGAYGRQELTTEQRRAQADNAPYADRERAKAAPVIDKETGEVLSAPAEVPSSFAELMARRDKLPPELQPVVPTDEAMHMLPPKEATDEVAFMVAAIVRVGKARGLSPKEWGDDMERFHGGRRLKLYATDGVNPNPRLNPFFLRAHFLYMDTPK